MRRWKKIGLWILGILVILFLFMAWYQRTYSMKAVDSYEVNDPTNHHRILIATQGSEFKDSLVQEVVNDLKTRPTFIRVIDISTLPQIKVEEWTVIIILHTWENWKPQEDAKAFIDRTKDKRRLIVLSTSGAGDFAIEGIDGITAASRLSEVSFQARKIIARVENVLKD